MRILILFYCLVFTIQILISCNTNYELQGLYTVTDKTFQDRILLNNMKSNGRILGSEMTLHKDSTFTYSTCGSIMNGIWRRYDDTLLLFVRMGKFASDSLQRIRGHELNSLTIKFLIQGNQLYRTWDLKDSTKTVELLKKKSVKNLAIFGRR